MGVSILIRFALRGRIYDKKFFKKKTSNFYLSLDVWTQLEPLQSQSERTKPEILNDKFSA